MADDAPILGQTRRWTREEYAEHLRREAVGLDCGFCLNPISIGEEKVGVLISDRLLTCHRTCAEQRDAHIEGG